ncbi:ABC transporter permease [Cellulomonas bogoriensis]|uniref:ABC transporter permease n=1 Tax=Cellulomonas bogoriensis 69B4 = DSM 16987 TaxID=1386082 RepID=A0A0A0C1V1_9CELL|nr:ABC transporter permease [Cellulomonas bogoriensis]KGM13354.1 ABC transporter permease [Cellulomonas bogoriensis 69B4 = DSM 16987]
MSVAAPPQLGTGPGASPAASDRAPTSWKGPLTYGLLGTLALVVFAVLGRPGTSTFSVATPGDLFHISPVGVPSRLTALVLSLLCLGLAALAAVRTRQGRPTPGWVPGTFAAAFVLAFLSWAVAGESIPFTGLLQGTLFLAVPLVFGAISGLMCERTGVINIAIEGQLLAGAFLAAVAATLSGNVYVGLVAAPVAGLAVGLLLAIFTITYGVNQIIVGVVLNVLVIGLTGFLYSTVLATDAANWNQPPGLRRIAIPLLSDIPVIGPVVFNQNLIVYLMYATVVAANVALFRSRWGLRVRAVGEHPRAADTVGIKVNLTRYKNVLLGGAIAGLGGAFFTIGAGLAFGREMTAGKGYIALAAMIFGRWSPKGALAAALLFGFAEQLRISLGIVGTGIPSQFMLMTPYLVTIFAVAGLVGRVRPPAANGTHYSKA